jgi:hypothetical protein
MMIYMTQSTQKQDINANRLPHNTHTDTTHKNNPPPAPFFSLLSPQPNSLQPAQRALLECKCHTCPLLPQQFAHVDRVRRLESKEARLRHWLSNESLSLFPDFQQRLGVWVCFVCVLCVCVCRVGWG